MDYETKRRAHQAAIEKCNEACETGDLVTIKRLFGFQTSIARIGGTAPTEDEELQALLGPDDAHECLIWVVGEDDLPVSRGLLELGIVDLHRSPIRLLTGVKSQAMLEVLAEFGFDFRQYGHNILHQFITPISILRYLLDLGADPKKPIVPSLVPFLKKGETDNTTQCLNEAAAQCDIPAFELLVSRGAEPARSIALHRATRFKGANNGGTTVTDMIAYLIDRHGMDPNAKDDCAGLRDLMTAFREEGKPLEYALANENREAAVALVKKGAEPGRVTNKEKADGIRRLIDGIMI
ncbi:hypothetical protein QBC37DRAFT_322731 [Rhypophila decipiens]|uniref:Ankyrin repeat domain-containing protein n=1 Tax=Rhypophila decipiens TaxID=261697 RepID=A0AAN7B6P7_9PEZI|nr:hypothetical protein QBC37DRAFT_322731 [Rhypophila decipiens]